MTSLITFNRGGRWICTSVALALCCFSVAAMGQETAPKPAATPPPNAPSPSDTPQPAASPQKSVPVPVTDPATLPPPALGLDFVNPNIVDAAKLVEHGEFKAAMEVLNHALSKTNAQDRSGLDELRAGKMMILIRSGKCVEAAQLLPGLTTGSVPDSSVNESSPHARQGQFLDLVAKASPSADKANPAPLASAQAWMAAIQKATMGIRDNLHETQKTTLLHASHFKWHDVGMDVETGRKQVECLACVRDSVQAGVWNEAMQLHGATIEDAVAAINRRAGQLKEEIKLHGSRMHRIGAAVGARWKR